MPTMRDDVTNYGGVQDYGYETEEWPVDWDSEVRESRHVDGYTNGWGLVPSNGNTHDPRLEDVAPLSLLRYEPVETGVGCAEHGLPECLCDVVIDNTIEIMVQTSEYEWADLSGLKHGTANWWRSILGVHTAKDVLVRLASEPDGSIGRLHGKFGNGTDIVRYALDLDNVEGLTHQQVADTHGVGYGAVQHARRKLAGKVKSKSTKHGKVCDEI